MYNTLRLRRYSYIPLLLSAMILWSCGASHNGTTETTEERTTTIQTKDIPHFNADSALAYIVAQCDFGPRTVNSTAHQQCGDYLTSMFKRYGCQITEQHMTLQRYDGEPMHCRNIIASYNPGQTRHIILCSHWDSRPWADNDPDPSKHRTPILGANDGASGVAILLEIARLTQQHALPIGIDFILFDAEDAGTPQWADSYETEEDPTWCLGSQYWAEHPHHPNYKAEYGILLDMVGGHGATFYKESFSTQYAPSIVNKIWETGNNLGYGSFFVDDAGGYITDDHLPLNRVAKIPTADIIPYHPETPNGSSFGPTWHTLQDTPQNISTETLKAVGQTITQLLYSLYSK